MVRSPKVLLIFLSLLLVFTNCRNKDFDEYYARPGWLAGPIYQQLEAKGRFTLFLACIKKTPYANILGRSGYFTIFAPNDSAFKVFLKERGYNSINDLDSLTLHKIVDYSIINNGYSKIQLAAYQNAGNNSWGQDMAYKRQTFYRGFYQDSVYINRYLSNLKAPVTLVDYNQKYIPYFIQSFLDNNGLSADDYHAFYPGVAYSGFNVADASVVNADIVAENGFIHEVNKVILPLPSLEEYLISQKDYSTFKNLVDKFVNLLPDTACTLNYGKYTGYNGWVYKKKYSDSLSFRLNDEELSMMAGNLSQTSGWTLLAPTNTVMNQFIHDRFLKYYSSIDQINVQNPLILTDFLNTLVTSGSLWPKSIATISGSVVQKSLCSNGFFYGVNAILTNDFNTVYSEVYLNPSCRVMLEWIKAQPSLKDELIGHNYRNPVKYTAFMISDSAVLPVLRANGYVYNKQLHFLQKYDATGNLVSAWNDAFVSDLFNRHIVAADLSSVSGEGYYPTLGQDYVGFKNNLVFNAASRPGTGLSVSSPNLLINGTAYAVRNDIFMNASTRGVVKYIARDPKYSSFFSYLQNSGIYNPTDTTIRTMLPGVYYTILVPTNSAMAAAGLPLATASDAASIDIIKKFLLYHIVPEVMIFTDGQQAGQGIKTQAQINSTGLPVYGTINVTKAGSSIQITDMLGNTANIAVSNVMGYYTVLQSIDRVLKFQ